MLFVDVDELIEVLRDNVYIANQIKVGGQRAYTERSIRQCADICQRHIVIGDLLITGKRNEEQDMMRVRAADDNGRDDKDA